MKIKTAIPTLMIDGAIFKHLTILPNLDMTAAQLGIKYNFRSGEKTANSLIENYVGSDGKLDETAISLIGNLINDYFKYNWGRMLTALTAQYNPIENYDRNELSTVAGSGSDSDTYGAQTNNYGQRKVTDVHSVTPYDSSTMSPDDKNEQTEDAKSDTLGTHTDTHTKGTTETTTSRIHGNVGVTTNQHMITEELELRKQNIIERIMADVDSFIALKIYE